MVFLHFQPFQVPMELHWLVQRLHREHRIEIWLQRTGHIQFVCHINSHPAEFRAFFTFRLFPLVPGIWLLHQRGLLSIGHIQSMHTCLCRTRARTGVPGEFLAHKESPRRVVQRAAGRAIAFCANAADPVRHNPSMTYLSNTCIFLLI